MNNLSAIETKKTSDWPLVLLAYSFCVPEQVSFFFLGLKFFVFRIILLLLIPSIISAYKNQTIVSKLTDTLVVAALAWLFASQLVTIGIAKAAANGGASIIDLGLTYFVARSRLTSIARARELLVKLGPAFLLAGSMVAFETLSGHYIVQPFVSRLTGQPVSAITDMNSGRLGLLRGTGPFPHPILGGLQLASLLPIFLLSNIPIRARLIGVVGAFTAIFTISSSVLIAIILCLFLVAFEVVRERVPVISWNGFMGALIAGLTGVQLFTPGGVVKIIVNYLTLDKWTAYYRTLIWQYGLENVYRHPWFGLGLEDWSRPYWMTESIDNYWLYLAITYGVPESLLRVSIAVIAAIVAGRNMNRFNTGDRRIMLGFIIGISMMTLMAFTVTFWGVTQAWYYFLIGCTVSLGESVHNLPDPARRTAAHP